MNIIYFNQQYIEKDQARVPVMDRGFLFGDAVYEVIPYFKGQPLGQIAHLERLQRSLSCIDIKACPSSEQWLNILETLIEKNQLSTDNFSIYIQVSRGSTEQRTHVPSLNNTPTLVAFCMPMTSPDPTHAHKAILAEDTRHTMCHVKSTNLLANTILLQKAHQQGALEVILHKQGYITECSSSNVFIVKDRIIQTPPESNNILSGITRAIVLELAKQHALTYQESLISVAEIKNADEIWITSSTKQICPITQLDDSRVGTGQAGPIWAKMSKLFTQHQQALERTKETPQ